MVNRFQLLGGLVGCGACLLIGSPKSGQCAGPYFNVEAGVAVADRVNLDNFFGPTPGTRLDLDPGGSIGFAGGYNFNQFIGLELQSGFIYNNIKSLPGTSGDGSLSHVPLMGNVVLRYDQPNFPLVPYAGAGAGGDISIISLDHAFISTGSGTVFADGSDSALVFAWQAFAGLRYKLTEHMSLGAGYKYYAADKASWEFDGPTDSITTGKARIHNFLFEFNMKF